MQEPSIFERHVPQALRQQIELASQMQRGVTDPFKVPALSFAAALPFLP